MFAANLRIRTIRAGLVAAGAIVSVALAGNSLARSSENCAPRAASPLAAFEARQHGTGLLAAARWLSSNRSEPRTDGLRARPPAEGVAPLSAVALQARVARYRVGPPESELHNSLAYASAGATIPTHCQRGG